MKRFVAVLFCTVIIAALPFTGCTQRSLSGKPVPASSVSEPEPPPPPEPTVESEPESAPQASSKPKETYPAPELNDTERKMLEQNVRFFLSYTDVSKTPIPSPKEAGNPLLFCLVQAFQQKDLFGYYFDEDGNGNYLVPAAIVAEVAQRSFGLERYTATEDKRYDAQTDCYRYSTAHDQNSIRYALSTPKGAPDGNIAYDVEFYDPSSASQSDAEIGYDEPLYAARYTFKLLRLNGMPYLQFVSKEIL